MGVGDFEGGGGTPDEIVFTLQTLSPGSTRDDAPSRDDELGGGRTLNGAGEGGGDALLRGAHPLTPGDSAPAAEAGTAWWA